MNWTEHFERAKAALLAAELALERGDHVTVRAKLWECLRAINQISDASLDASPVP